MKIPQSGNTKSVVPYLPKARTFGAGQRRDRSPCRNNHVDVLAARIDGDGERVIICLGYSKLERAIGAAEDRLPVETDRLVVARQQGRINSQVLSGGRCRCYDLAQSDQTEMRQRDGASMEKRWNRLSFVSSG